MRGELRQVGLVLIAASMLGACDASDHVGDCGEPGVACLYAGTGERRLGHDGLAPEDTALYWVADLEFAPDGTPYVLDWNNHLVRRVIDGKMETIMGEFVGDGPPDMSDLMEPGADGLSVRLNHPTDIQFDRQGRLVLCAWHNHKLRVWDPDTRRVLVEAGRGAGFAGDGMTMGADTRFNQPKAIVFGPDDSLYVLDQRNHRIRRIAPDGMVSTIAGTGMPGFSGDDGPALDAQLQLQAGGNPEPSGGLTIDEHGVLYVADGLNHRIRRIDEDGIITTIAGTGEPGFGGDGGDAVDAQIDHPRDVELGPDGRLYFADTENSRIRAIDLETGTIETVVGSGTTGEGPANVPAEEVNLNRPFGIAFDAEGALYVADTYNSRVLKVVLQ